MTTTGFTREDIDEDPATFHARDFEGGDRLLWVPTLDGRRTLVLGSTQPDDEVDLEVLTRTGTGLARRRTGGGAVLVGRDELVWFDVVLGASDPLWNVDVGRSFEWLGHAVRRALHELGVETEMHTGALRRTSWSGRVCFAGVGPGELLWNGRKVVGISQRRTRSNARFQVAILRRWDAREHLEFFRVPVNEQARAEEDLTKAAIGVDHSPDDVMAAISQSLTET